MKIVSVDLIECKSIPGVGQTPVFCRINTDEGIYGIGEAGVSISGFSKGSFAIMRNVASMLIGKNPLYHDQIWEMLMKDTFWGHSNGAVIMGAFSAIDTALWDIKGKYYNAPVYELLGGKYRDKLRCYASQLQFGWKNDEFFTSSGDLGWYREAYHAALDEGYTAIKVNFFYILPDGKKRDNVEFANYIPVKYMREFEKRIELAREVCGPDVEIIVENHAITSANSAIQFGRMAEPYDIMFYEEPCTNLNPAEMRRIADNVAIPLAAGERIYTRWGYLPYFENQSLSVIQPDLGNCGGITEGRKICDLAHIHGVTVQTHTCNSPVSVAASLHFEAAIPNFVIHEMHTTNTLHEIRKLCIYDYQPINGEFDIPDLPGIGQDLSDYALKNATIITET